MKEDKRAILHDLLHVLWKTNAGKDVIDLQLAPDERVVKVVFHSKGIRTWCEFVDVEGCDGLEMAEAIVRSRNYWNRRE